MDETQNDAPFVTFYDMHAVTFVPPDEMADVTIAGLQWFIRAITQKLSKQELWFMCTAFPLDEIYPPIKFHNHS